MFKTWRFRSDSGEAYVNSEFPRYCQTTGISERDGYTINM